MFHSLKRLWLVWVLLLSGTQSMFGFALLGPESVDTYQVNTIGYFLSPPSTNSVDLGAPKNLGEGYRWNTVNLYYAYDANFVDFFGSNGMAAVDQAFGVYNSLSNIDSYSPGLTEWPQTSIRNNYTASAVGLLDLKSFTMQMIAEQLGLAQPERWTYCLHDRDLVGGAVCPNYSYLVIQRNFDPLTQIYSQYVNGTLYGFQVIEECNVTPNPLAPEESDAVEYFADPAAFANGSTLAVASYGLDLGQFYTSLTRDDIGGLRYLYSSNRINVESVSSNSLEFYTNTSNVQLLVTSNLALFSQQALTNSSSNLVALYPGLLIASSSNYFTNVVTTNVTATFTYPSGAPAGTLVVVFTTNYTTNVGTNWVYTFANVVTNTYYTNGFITTQYTNVYVPPGAPAGYSQTNVVSNTVFSSFVNGDFYIIPTNLCGPYQILSTQLVSILPVTNIIGTNTTVTSGATNATLTNGQSTTFNLVTYFTNHSLLVYPVQCDTNNSVLLREGVEKINFIRRDYDSLLGGLWTPITNFYTVTSVTNSAPLVQTYMRVVTQPDFLITAQDLASGPAALPANSAVTRSTPNYDSAQALAGLAGPGTLQPGITFTYNKVGPVYDASNPSSITDGTAGQDFEWGSFDGTTNAPVVYPSTVSLSNLVSQIFFQIITPQLTLTNASLTTNNAGNPYNVQLQATGATPPYTWSIATNSTALPNGLSLTGLSLSSAGVISGVPTNTGTYDFTVQATDSGARVTQKNFFIMIGP